MLPLQQLNNFYVIIMFNLIYTKYTHALKQFSDRKARIKGNLKYLIRKYNISNIWETGTKLLSI